MIRLFNLCIEDGNKLNEYEEAHKNNLLILILFLSLFSFSCIFS